MKKILLLAAPLLIGAILNAHAEEPTPPDNSKIIWHTITVVDYKPGTLDAAKGFIQKFESASTKAGSPSPVIYWFESGKYDLVLTWKLKEEPATTDGIWSPAEDHLWWEALVAQEGSEEAARLLQANYKELIETSITNVSCKAN